MQKINPRLILGSASPRRLELLAQIGIVPDLVMAADIDETPHQNEKPDDYCVRIAQQKNAVLATQFPDDFILTADTVVAVGRRILGKPRDESDAKQMLQLLSGRAHHVYTCVVLHAPGKKVAQKLSTTRAKVKRLSDRELAAVLATGDWRGVSGAYRLQGHFIRFIMQLQGSPSGVIGLPLFETMQLLQGAGYDHS